MTNEQIKNRIEELENIIFNLQMSDYWTVEERKNFAVAAAELRRLKDMRGQSNDTNRNQRTL